MGAHKGHTKSKRLFTALLLIIGRVQRCAEEDCIDAAEAAFGTSVGVS
jgi:hypothetical protein